MSNIEKREITTELKESYLDYAMSVIVSRALPDLRDGLKPVQRRVLWAMWDSGVTHAAKFRKSANVVGETMGRYHPHGDSSIYDTIVRLAQKFSLRYPLIQGQGNFGSIDGDSAAAMRYTEIRLSKIAEELLTDIEKETVLWQPNYDGTRDEPKVLPAKLPNLLLNGTVGIAVGMATNIPPHNLQELADAILYLIENPDATVKDLLKFVKGPDFPTGGVIYDKRAIEAAYTSGRGPVTIRAKTEIVEERKAGQFDIVVSELPFQVNKSELVKKMAELVQEKKAEGIRNIRDESDREGLRIVIEVKNDVPPQKVLNQLFKHTDLQKDFHFNMIALVEGLQPQLLSLKDVLAAYLDYRKSVIRKRTEFDLKKAVERAHVLEGLVKALDNIDRVIQTIRKSSNKEEAHANLVRIFKLSALQATAILEMRLQALAALERTRVEEELKEKRALIKELELILKSPLKIAKIIKDEVAELRSKYGDERRTQVVAGGLGEIKDEDLIPDEETMVTLSSGGYVKRLPPDTFKTQRRGGKGLIGSDVAEEDFLTHFFTARTHDNLLFFTDRGRVFQTKAHEIPGAARTAKGKAIVNFLELQSGENIAAIVAYAEGRGTNADQRGNIQRESSSILNPQSSPRYLVMVTKNGLVKKTPIADFKNIRRTGIIAISLKKGDALKWVRLSSGNDHVLLSTEQGQSIRFKESQIRSMGRGAAGIRGIRLRGNDHVAGFDVVGSKPIENSRILVVMANGFAKQTTLKEYKVQNRGGSGIKTAKVTPKTGIVIVSRILTDETEIFALSAKGQIIRTGLEGVRTTGRSAQGVRIMNLKSGDRIAGVAIT